MGSGSKLAFEDVPGAMEGGGPALRPLASDAIFASAGDVMVRAALILSTSAEKLATTSFTYKESNMHEKRLNEEL